MLKWHSYAETYPLMEGDEFLSHKGSIKETGGNTVPILYRMVNGEKQGLDGRNRERACIDLGLPLREQEVFIDDADVEKFIDVQNWHRRHLTKEFRQARIAKLRTEGKSMRSIAKLVGVSVGTVQNNISSSQNEDQEQVASGVQFYTPESAVADSTGDSDSEDEESTPLAEDPLAVPTPPPTPERVTGKDGKSYPSAKPKPLCVGCERRLRKGQQVVKGCPDCKAIRDAGKPPKTRRTKGAGSADNGELIEDESIEDNIKRVNGKIESFCRGIMKYVEDNLPDDPWLQDQDRLAMARNKFRNGCDTLRSAKCFAACPLCGSDGCDACRGTGRVTKMKYDMLVTK